MANAPTLTSGARFLTLLTTLWSVHVRSVCLVLLLLLLAGCGLWKKDSGVLLPVADLYQQGEEQLRRQRYEDARTTFKRLTESHADTEYAPRARFLIGEAFYREQNYDEAVKALQEFLTFYPAHPIADLAQYRLALSYYDQLQPVEKDQGLTAKALAEFQKLVKTYPESRYASDALAKMEICRLRLAQKELWVAQYYYDRGQYAAALRRLEAILRVRDREGHRLLVAVPDHEDPEGVRTLVRRMGNPDRLPLRHLPRIPVVAPGDREVLREVHLVQEEPAQLVLHRRHEPPGRIVGPVDARRRAVAVHDGPDEPWLAELDRNPVPRLPQQALVRGVRGRHPLGRVVEEVQVVAETG